MGEPIVLEDFKERVILVGVSEQDGDDDQKQHDAPADHHGFRHLQAAEGDHLHIQLFFQGRSQCVHFFASFLSRVLS